MMRAHVAAISVALPGQTVSNDDLLTGVERGTRDLLIRHTGVRRRGVASAEETALDFGERACVALFEQYPDLAKRIDTLIFCTQSPDHVLPPNSCVLHGRLALRDSVAAFDLPHACSAYIYAIKLTQALIASGSASDVLVVTADTYSKFIHPLDRSARLLFGDGAAATWFTAAAGDAGVLDVVCGSEGKFFDKFYVPAGGSRHPLSDAVREAETRDSSGNVRSPAHIHMSGRDILSFVSSRIPCHVREVLARNGLTTDDIDCFVFHQASAVTLDSLVRLLNLDPAKVVRHMEDVGNMVSASIPTALDAALQQGAIGPGDLALLCGFGAGLSWGSALVRW